MEATHRLIVHGIMKVKDKYLIIKRTKVKRGKPNVYPGYWDIPGGMVEKNELPTDALIREVKEEVNLDVKVNQIIQEDSKLDKDKNIVFTRLVYLCDVINNNILNIELQLDEHDEYRLIESSDIIKEEKIVEYVKNAFKNKVFF